MKNILVLGAGLVAPPLVRYLLGHRAYRLVVAAGEFGNVAERLAGHDRARMIDFDISDERTLDHLVEESDIVVSLLPVQHLPTVIRAAVRHRKNVVNTSYRTPEVRALEDAIRDAGIVVISEMGLDPGIDHMTACRVIRGLRARGATITEFSSACGGFPAPDANDNPWGYKFSWNPRAVILAARNAARYRANGQAVSIPGADLFAHSWPLEIEHHGLFEVYPNRDALVYAAEYGLDETPSVFRGTLRYPGWCATLGAAAKLGLFELEAIDWPETATFVDLVTRRLPASRSSLVGRLASFLGTSTDSEVISRFEWAGLLSDRRLCLTRGSPLDLFVGRLSKLMMYRPGERDMVALQHTIVAAFPDRRLETIRSSLIRTGRPWGETAMSETVSLPAAIATRMLLDRRKPAVSGLCIPTTPELYDPVLAELEQLGITAAETVSTRHVTPFDPSPMEP